MKRPKIKIAAIAMLTCALLFYSCSTQDDKMPAEQTVTFGFSARDLSIAGGRSMAINDDDIAGVVVSIKNTTGSSVVTLKKLALFKFNERFISEPLALVPGNYSLYEFFVTDHNNNVLFAAPVKGSPKAYLVANPLELPISVTSNNVAEVTPEVLKVGDSNAQDFGYATFSFQAIETFDFLVSVFIWNSQTNKFELTSASIVISDLSQKFKYIKDLAATTNAVTLPALYSQYWVKIEKPGYLPYIKIFDASELRAFSNVNGPLTVTLKAGSLVFWNKLGSNDEVLHSVVGPNLAFFTGGSFPHGAANREYVAGKIGNCITIAPGQYYTQERVHNLVLNDLPTIINSERGAIECYYYQRTAPIAFSHNPHRIVDGQYGFESGMGFVSIDPNEDGRINALQFYLTLGGATVSVNSTNFESHNWNWVHIAAVWDRSGIGSSNETMQLYINGSKAASSTANNWGATVGPRADIAGGNDSSIARQFYIDELKIYNFAKTDY